MLPLGRDDNDNYNHVTKYPHINSSSMYNNLDNRVKQGVQLTSPVYSTLNHVGDRSIVNGFYRDF